MELDKHNEGSIEGADLTCLSGGVVGVLESVRGWKQGTSREVCG